MEYVQALEHLQGQTLETLMGRPFVVDSVSRERPDCLVRLQLSSGSRVCISHDELESAIKYARSGGALDPSSLRAAGMRNCSYIGAVVAKLIDLPFPPPMNRIGSNRSVKSDVVVSSIRTSERNGMRHVILESTEHRWHVTLRSRNVDDGVTPGVTYWIRRDGAIGDDDQDAIRLAIEDIECWLSGRERSGKRVERSDTPFLDTGVDIVAYARGMPATFDSRLQDIIISRYERNETLQQIGDRYGLSRERIRQLEQKAIRAMTSDWNRRRSRLSMQVASNSDGQRSST